jgi:hypothetical protein
MPLISGQVDIVRTRGTGRPLLKWQVSQLRRFQVEIELRKSRYRSC